MSKGNLSTLLPIKLDKDNASYQSVEELDNVLSQAEQRNIRNVAITGPYGSGKSSILLTLRGNYPEKREYLPISLATLQANEEETNESAEKDEAQIEGLNRKIEYSILQQLIYREETGTVRNSRLRRIVHIPNDQLRNLSLGIVLTILAFFILFEPEFARVETLCSFFDFGKVNIAFDFLSLSWLLYALYRVVKYLINAYSNSKLNKLNLKDGEIEIQDNSIFNKYLDEILYFFQVTSYNVVIFEDLDRFGTSKIFLKLRELNQLINESKIVGRHITFIYAVKDDIFKDEERTKFFDYIITVIPVINPSNSKDKLKEALKLHGETDFNDDDISEMAFFIQDMRILTNIVNEYVQYRSKLCEYNKQQLDQTKLLAMIVYKNYFPKDFADLHRRKGKVYDCISNKRRYIDEALSNLNEQENKVHEAEKEYNSSAVKLHKELRALYISCLDRYINTAYEFICLKDNQYTKFQIIDSVELFNELVTAKTITVVYSDWNHNRAKKSVTIDPDKVVKEVGYAEKKDYLTIQSKGFKAELRRISKEKMGIRSLTLSELITNYNIGKSDLYKGLELPPLMDIFIRRGYLNEEYYDYISFFYEGMVSFSDKDLLTAIKQDKALPFDYHIDKIENFVKELTDYMFESDAILNNEVLDFISCNTSYREQFENFMRRLEKANSPLSFLAQYFQYGKNVSGVFSHIIEWNNESTWERISCWQNIDERDNLTCGYLQNVKMIIPSVRQWISDNYPFIAKHVDDISLDACLKLVPDSEFVNLCDDSTDLLDAVIEYNSYIITLANLWLITRQLTLGNGEATTPENLNITRIHSTNNSTFRKYIDENIEDVVSCLKNELKDDSSESLLFVLNQSDDLLHEAEKIKYLTGQKNKIADFSRIESDEMHTVAVKTNIIQATWENVSTYLQEVEGMSPELKDYILQNKEELSNQKVDNAITKRDELFMAIFGTEDFQSSLVEQFNNSFNHQFNGESELQSLSADRLKLLLKLGKIPFSQANLEVINDTEILDQYLLRYSADFSQHLDWDYKFNTKVAIALLSSDKFNDLTKVSIISQLNSSVCTSSAKLSNLIIAHPVEKLLNSKDNAELIAIHKVSNDTISRLRFAIGLIAGGKLTEAQVSEVLTALGGQYGNLCEPNKRPRIIKTDDNEKLLNALQHIKYISSFKAEDGKNVLKVVNRQK
jgi:hypothetical protein